MNVDLLSSIELTASAAIVIAALSIGFGSNAAMGIRIAIWLSAWFVLVVILAAARVLYYQHGLGTPGLGLAVALPIAILCITVTRIKSLRDAFHRVPLWLLVGVHTVRRLASVLSFFTPSTVCRRRSPRLLVGATFLSERRRADSMARVSADHKCSGDCMDLEPHRQSRI